MATFGSKFTIKQLGSISTPSTNQLLIQPWDASYISYKLETMLRNAFGPVVESGLIASINNKSVDMTSGKYFYGLGKRKSAVAQVRIYPVEKPKNGIMVNEKETERKRVADTDIGKEIQEEIEDLKLLLSAYKQGKIKENI
jgi:hypothetical protein